MNTVVDPTRTPWIDGTIVYQRVVEEAAEERQQPRVDTGTGGDERQVTDAGDMTSLQPHQMRVIVHNDTSQSLNDVVVKWFTGLKKYGLSMMEGVAKDKSSLISNASPIDIYTLNLDEFSDQESQKTTALENVKRSWCEFVSSNSCRHLWLEVKHLSTSEEALSAPKHKVEVMSMSLGSFPSPARYCCHWRSGPQLKIDICFEYDLEIVMISYDDNRRGQWRLETSLDHLDKFLLVNPFQTGFHVYLFQKNPFKILKTKIPLPYTGPTTTSEVIDKEELAETEYSLVRQVCFGDCPSDVIGSSNVVRLKLGKSDLELKDVLSRLAKLGFSIVTGNPENASPQKRILQPKFDSFQLTYAWYCLESRGFRVTDQLTEAFVADVSKTPHQPWLEATIKAVTAAFDNSSICNLEDQFHEESEKIRRQILAGELEDEDDRSLVPNVVAVRRLILTPTAIKGMGEEWTVDNRVLREFGADRFVRISFRDEDFTRLTGYVPIKEITERVINILRSGLEIGNRNYRFLGCSNSQMRSHSVWMYASDGEHTVESIRKWMGDISHERCVATYVSRLGQCFTSTRNTVEVAKVEQIKDITRETNYCFTDGIGRISTTLADRVKKTLRLGYTPSAFQIRFGGCKGVVALAPDIGEEEKLQIRESMKKFPSDHNHIEVVETTRPVRLCLNRQAMLLLSGLGVSDDSFFKLQDRMLENMAKILIDEDTAAKAIAKAHLGIELKDLLDSGIAVTLEPFLREVLATLYRQRFNDLLKRTHIEIPEDKGRMMMGTVDEFDCLEYGEVFVQFSKAIDKPMQEKEVLDGSVVVTKSPCFHPGDMRKFTAVDRVQLHHMVDCIVFPAKGQRPHPNEMSGSDLDGDLYFVCWEESLIPPEENEKPMDFTPKEKKVLSKEVTESDMIQFISDYISSDQLGVIANAHLVHADSKDIYCEQCIQIAKQHSDAVDFPKTGQIQKFPRELRPASYPDYMMKTDKPSYISDTVIGKLFHQCRAIGLSNEFRKLEPFLPDPDLILPGHETYLDEAKRMKAIYDIKIDELRAMYGIETEVELLSVGALGIKERLGHLKGDHYAATQIIRLRIQTIREKMKNMFLETLTEYDNALLCLKASALYRVSYSCPDNDLDKCSQNQKEDAAIENVEKAKNTEGANKIDEPYRKSLGLPWIFSHLLCMIKQESRTVLRVGLLYVRDPLQIETEVRPTSFLHKLNREMDDIVSTEDYWKKKQISCHDPLLIERLKLWNGRTSSDSEYGVKLICFGSAITSCAGDRTSLDIYVRNDHLEIHFDMEKLNKIATDLAKFVQGTLTTARKSRATNRVKIVNVSVTSTEINLYLDEQFLRRTAYIVAAVMLNKWTVPVLRVVLEWGRSCKIADGSSGSLLTEEELTIMFYHAVINGMKYGNPIRDADLRESTLLIVKNHFQTCQLFTCTHLQTDSLAANGSSNTEEFSELGDDANAYEGHSDGIHSMENVNTRCGQAILGFYLFYGTSRGANLKGIPDPRLQPTDEQRLLKLKDEQYVQVGEQMLEAYHSLANCASIDDFISPMGEEDRRFSMILPNEVTSLYRYVEATLQKNLKRKTGVSVVNVRKKKFRGLPSGLVIEAWGNAIAIKSLSAEIHKIICSAACFTAGKIARDRYLIKGAFRTTFEGIFGPSDMLRMVKYEGRYQDWHEPRQEGLRIPLVNSYRFDSTDAYNMKKVSDYFEEQRDFIRKNYNPEIHGRIRVTISFGNFYTQGYPSGPIKASELGEKLFKGPKWRKAAHVKSDIQTDSDFRRIDPRNHVRRHTSEYCRPTLGRSGVPSPQLSNNSGGSSSRPFGRPSDATYGNPVQPRANAQSHSCDNSPRQTASNDSSEYLAENTRFGNSSLRQSDATGHSINCQNPTSNASSIGLVGRQTPQQAYGVPEVGRRTISDHGRRQNSAPDYAPTLPRGYIPNKYSAFLPIDDLDVDRFNNFVKANNFIETEHQREYRVSINGVADITLDENSNLTMYRLQDIKWYVFNVVRGRMGERFRDKQLKDIRIQMRSRPFITAEELKARPGCEDLLEKAKDLLHRNIDGEVDGIELSNYKRMIEYIRYKDRTSYKFGGKKTRKNDDGDDVFLNRFTMKLNNKGKEHRLQKKTDSFRKTDHTEVLLETDLPNLKDKEECEEFMREIYEFAKYFAKEVIDKKY